MPTKPNKYVDTSDMFLVPPAAPNPAPNPPKPPIFNSAVPTFSPLALGPAPNVMRSAADAAVQFYRTGMSQVRMPTIPPAAAPASGAQSESTIRVVIAPLASALAAAQAAIKATGYQGAWNATQGYDPGALVELGGEIYLCIAANANATPPNVTFWQLISSVSFSGAWSSTTAYTIGEIVSESGALYIAIANSTNENPASTSGYWSLLSNTSAYIGNWSASVQYSVGNTVSYTDGNFYIAIVANKNVAPAPTGSTDWVLLGSSNTLIGAWSSSTTYTAGNEVTYTGNIWQSLVSSNLNHTPPTPPATSSYWQLMGPSTLSNVPDGGGVYGGTAGGQSYRPNSNPLTSVDAGGGTATVDIAAFLLVVNNRSITSDVSYNSGTVTGLSYATVYYIYFSDPTLAGGSPTYLASTTKETALSGSGNIFIGSILTTVSGGPGTTGNNDGGSGAQYGNVAVNRPTVTATVGTWSNPGNSIDGAPNDSSQSGTASSSITLSGFDSSLYAGCSSITLNIDWKGVGVAVGKTSTVQRSLNGGSSFGGSVVMTGPFSRQTTHIALGVNINPGIVECRVTTDSAWTTGTLSVYQVWLTIQY